MAVDSPVVGLRRPLGDAFWAMLCVILFALLWAKPVQADQQLEGVDDRLFIIGGVPTEKNAFPWVVALTSVIDADLYQRQFCAGSIIADKWVLTAAHCLHDRTGNPSTPSSLKVAIDAADLSSPDATEIVVANVYIHPGYNPYGQNLLHDIALLELATSSGITPMPLSTKSTDKLVGLQATIVGWGAIDNRDAANLVLPVRMHGTSVPIVSNEVCNAPNSYAGDVFDSQLCAGYADGGYDSCTGDSGGPMFVTVDGVTQQAGVVSYGFGCALPNYYGIYTDIPFYIGWINQYVYVGEPEFEPELLELKAAEPATILRGGDTPSDTGSASWFALLVLCAGCFFRRRA